jgi:FecR protein
MGNGKVLGRLHSRVLHSPGIFLSWLLMILMLGTAAPVGRSQDKEDQAALDEIVARISLLAGEVSYQRTGESDKDWYEATINLPLATSDQLYTGSDGRVEIQIGSGNVIRLASESNLKFTRYTPRLLNISLPLGTVTLRIETIRGELQNETSTTQDGPADINYEISTPVASITLTRKGVYRLNVAADGTTELVVREGEAEIYRQENGPLSWVRGARPGLMDLIRLSSLLL